MSFNLGETNIIEVNGLTKNFLVEQPSKNWKETICSYFKPKYRTLEAVKGISFSVKKGEKIALIGPNGAGKSTTIKLLTGIFYPTSGYVKTLGKNPFEERKKLSCKMGVLFGQRSQLWQHLPVYDSFKLLSVIYDIPSIDFKKRLDQLGSIFQLNRLIHRKVKELSLGERMRCEFVATLLHNPEILFLDEPTIGLDIISKSAMRELIYERAEEDTLTIFLTSHDIADIEKVCDRIILINQGKIVVDNSVKKIKREFFHLKHVFVKPIHPFEWKPHRAITLKKHHENTYNFEVDLQQINVQEAINHIASYSPYSDLVVNDPPLEDIIKDMYQK